MWEALHRYNALTPEARRFFRRAVILLVGVRVLLRVGGYKQAQGWLAQKLQRNHIPRQWQSEDHSRIDLICRMVPAARRYVPFQTSCLEESLVLWYLLKTSGNPAALRIGVRKDSGIFEAHAWVEQDGVALNQHEEQHRHYSPFDREFAGNTSEPS